MSRSRNAPARGQGAAKARQMGLLLDLDGGADLGGDDGALEAELLSLVGGGGQPGGKKNGGRAPVPMEDIERMAALCMKDLDEDEEGDDDGDLESDADLLAELNDVLDEEEERSPSPAPPESARPAAIGNAKAAGESSKARRYDRGLKTLQSLLSSVKKGKPINEEDIPPPVATGANPAPESQPEPIRRVERPSSEPAPAPPVNEKPLRDAPAPPSRPQLLTPPQKTLAVTPGTPLISPLTPSQPDTQHSEAKSLVLSRQREYKLAAIQAKQGGDTDLAKRHYLTAKRLDVVVEALDRGEPLDIGALPPPPGDVVAESPAPPTQRSSQPPRQPPQPLQRPLWPMLLSQLLAVWRRRCSSAWTNTRQLPTAPRARGTTARPACTCASSSNTRTPSELKKPDAPSTCRTSRASRLSAASGR
ncbi:hypothetical protein ANANG_G00033470 [Anguilla anguilla]|uniref:DM14 domain-containing protein n=1 Tax=Anguilla anguilla TaxID=7936 RepID=A0A9D3MS64_ANGAN|nr:hypothetical protein ANANG_G00033470 [Anguilla anguilla]